MKMRYLVILWLVISIFMGMEYLALHGVLGHGSIMQVLFCKQLNWCRRLSPLAGRPLSYTLGWLGFCVMALTNLYILRKRMISLQKVGNVQSWLNWHIFFGMLGPTLILFHCDFRVRGLVSISFWSMVVSFLSGIVGRYFYIQLLQGKGLLRQRIEALEKSFDQYEKQAGSRIPERGMLAAKAHAFALAGGIQGPDLKQVGILDFLWHSSVGGLHLAFTLPQTPWQESRKFRLRLKEWAILRRRLISMHYYQLLFGYWRSFHTPFAVWMYVVAVVHIVSSLIFKV